MAPSDLDNALAAITYAEGGYVDKACALLGGIVDDVLRVIVSAYVYHITGRGCPGVDLCSEFERVNKRLNELEVQVGSNPMAFLDNHPELGKYLEWRGLRSTGEALSFVIKEARAFALSGLGACALDKGDLANAEDYFGDAATVSREIGNWRNYLINRRRAISVKVLRGEELGSAVSEFKKLWDEALQNMVPTTPYLRTAAHVLSNYLITLALMGRHEDTEKLLREHGKLLDVNKQLSVSTRLALRYLGVDVRVPSNEEVLDAIKPYIFSALLPALSEILGVPVNDASELCARSEDSRLCTIAYMAVRGDKKAEKAIKQPNVNVLSRAGVPRDLLEGISVEQLIEVYAPRSSLEHFILLLRALVNGDRVLALLHAEVGRVRLGYSVPPAKLFGELAKALRSNDEAGVRWALAKLYYLHL